MISQKIIASFIIGAFIGGIGAWQFTIIQQRETISQLTKTLEDVYPPLESVERTLSGVVKAVNENEIRVEASIQTQRIPKPSGEGFETREITVLVGENTKIQRASGGEVSEFMFENIREGMNVFVQSEDGFEREGGNMVPASRIIVIDRFLQES